MKRDRAMLGLACVFVASSVVFAALTVARPLPLDWRQLALARGECVCDDCARHYHKTKPQIVLGSLLVTASGLVAGVSAFALLIVWVAQLEEVREARGRVDRCSACGYELAGLAELDGERCPECGTATSQASGATPPSPPPTPNPESNTRPCP